VFRGLIRSLECVASKRWLIKLYCKDYFRLSLAWPGRLPGQHHIVVLCLGTLRFLASTWAWMASEKCRRWATSSHAYVMPRLDEATDITLRSFESQRKEA